LKLERLMSLIGRGFHDWTKHPSIPIIIGHGAWVGAKVIILKGVIIGESLLLARVVL
jgi:acetyltransferase-like isoleucine patch superfamily enzyme